MMDSIEIQGAENSKMNSSTVIKQLKQGLKQDTSSQNDFQENKEKLPNNNPQINLELVNYQPLESEHIQNNNRNSKSLQNLHNKKNSNGKNAYSNFIKNIRSTTPVLNSMTNLNNPNKSKIKTSSSLSRTLNNFFKRKILVNDDDDKSSIINDDPIKLRNQFQHYLGKANDSITKEVSFKKLKEIISNNHSNDNLRVYISCLSTYCRNATVAGMEIYALLYGFISGVYKENLMDPIDNPPNIIKTINRILSHIRQYYLSANSYMVHKSSSRSICDIYDNCMPKDNIKTIYMIFFEPLFEILSSGTDKSIQEGAAICLMDFIYHLGENQKKNNINKKILDVIDDKIIALCTKSSMDNPYLFEALYNLINFNKIENYSKYLKEMYDRFIFILCKTNKNKYNYLMKLNCIKILNLIGNKIRNIADISIGYYQDEIYKVIEYNTKDKNAKVQIEAKKTLKTWKELKKLYEDIDDKKREIKDDINKDTFLNNNVINNKFPNNEENVNDEEEDITNQNENFIPPNENFNKLVKKMDKLNFLRNLAKRAKIENQKIDYDSQLPEKMKEEVYKKGISNILNLSKFLKHKLLNKEGDELKKEDISPHKKNKKNNLQNEIKDYLRHSKQVKKYDSIQKMQRDNIISKNLQKFKKKIKNDNDNDNIINEEINEDNFNLNEKENINQNELENNNINDLNDINDSQNENTEQFINDENQFQGQNKGKEENYEDNNKFNNNENEINDEENENQEEMIQENEKEKENPPKFRNKQKKNYEKNKNQLKEIPKRIKSNLNNNNFNNNQISDTKSYTNEDNNKDNKDIEEKKNEQNLNLKKINEINDNNIKSHLQNIFNEIIFNSFDEFEKNITLKLNEMNRHLNDISLKISDIQSHPNNISNIDNKKNYKEYKDKEYSVSSYKTMIENNTSFYINSKKMKINSKDYKDNAYSVSSYKPQAMIENNTSFYINSKKMKLYPKDSKNQSINTEEPNYNFKENTRNNIINDNNSIDSEVTKAWKETLKLIEKGYINEGYLKLLNSGDDIYLLRLICLTGPIIDKLDVEIAKRVLIRVNMISKSHQIQQLLIGLIKNSIKNNVFQMLEPNQQNYILDSLYEFSGLNNSIASEAAELYAELTK